MHLRIPLLVLATLLCVAWSGASADDPAPAAPPAPAAAPAPGPAGQKFTELFAEWEKLFAKVKELQDAYADAGAEEKETIEAEFRANMAEIETLAPVVADAAKAAYLESPNTDEDAVKMLVGMVQGASRRDDYEQGVEMARLLIDKQCPDTAFYDAAGVAFFCTNDFPAAAEYLQKAKQAGTLSEEGAQYLFLCDKYRQYWKVEQAIREQEAAADDLPRVKLETNKGDIVIELFENEAPLAVANFVSLVEKGYYDGLIFHRVLPHFMAQGGCPKGTGSGGPGYNIPCECYRDDYRKHFRGSLSMAHAGKDTGGSQFFLTFIPTSHLNGKHTVFGRVVAGMDVLAQLQRRTPNGPPPLPEPDKINKATVVRKRDHAYVPTKAP